MENLGIGDEANDGSSHSGIGGKPTRHEYFSWADCVVYRSKDSRRPDSDSRMT
jgi:hypothetical protein